MTAINPWAARFAAVSDPTTIARLTERLATPLIGLEKDPIEIACERIADALSEIFVPTKRCVEILQQQVERAWAHALSRYPDIQTFKSIVYREKTLAEVFKEKPLSEANSVWHLTGLGGTGKTQIGLALERLLYGPVSFDIDAEHKQLKFEGCKRLAQKSRNSLNAVLQLLAPPDIANGAAKLPGLNPTERCALWQYQRGICQNIVDEMQFTSLSASANALVARILLGLMYLNVPLLFVANFDLGHRLLKRPHQERQRYLVNNIVLSPDLPESEDWKKVLREYQRALENVTTIDFIAKAEELWNLSAGIKRSLGHLLVQSYRLCRKEGRQKVTWEDIEASYVSPLFLVQRTDIELLITQAITGIKKRNDLWCPFSDSTTHSNDYTNALRKTRAKQVSAAMAEQSMTAAEKQAYEMLKDEAKKKESSNNGAKLEKRPKKPAPNLANLIEAGNRFRKDL